MKLFGNSKILKSAVLLGLVVFLAVAVLVAFGFARWASDLLPYAGVSLGAFSGTLALVTERKTEAGGLTRWGQIALAGVIVSFGVTTAKLVHEQRVSRLERQSAEARAIRLAADARRAAIRTNGARVTIQILADGVMPNDYESALEQSSDRTCIEGGLQFQSASVCSCNSQFPDFGHSDLAPLRDKLSMTTVFLAHPAHGHSELTELYTMGDSFNEVLSNLESDYSAAYSSAVTIRTSLSDQRADCRGAIFGDRLSWYFGDEEYLTLSFIAPPPTLWRRRNPFAGQPQWAEGQTIYIASTFMLNTIADDDPWFVSKVFVELPDGTTLCNDEGPGRRTIQDVGGGFGAATVELSTLSHGRCGDD